MKFYQCSKCKDCGVWHLNAFIEYSQELTLLIGQKNFESFSDFLVAINDVSLRDIEAP